MVMGDNIMIANYSLLIILNFLSSISCIFVIIVYIHKGLYHSHMGKIVVSFCICSALKDTVSLLLTLSRNPYRPIIESSSYCKIYGLSITFGSIICWLLILAQTLNTFLTIVKGYNDFGKFEIPFIFLIILLPTISTIVIGASDSIDVVGNWCWIGPDFVAFRFVFFYGPLFFIWSVCLILYSIIAYYIFNTFKSNRNLNTTTTVGNTDTEEDNDHLKYQFRFSNYIIAFLICWLFPVSNRILNIFQIQPDWITIPHTLFSISHGAVASIVILYNNPSLDKLYYKSLFKSFKSLFSFSNIKRLLQFHFIKIVNLNIINNNNTNITITPSPPTLIISNQDTASTNTNIV